MNADGSEIRKVKGTFTTIDYAAAPQSSPDGTAIAFTSAAPGPTAPIVVTPATGGRPVEQVNRPGVSVPTDWR
jgi:Tol biopolymer transport system component